MILSAIIRWWLIGVLIYLPFQYRIVRSITNWNDDLGRLFRYIDELTLIVIFPVAVIKLLADKNISKMPIFLLMSSIGIFSISCILSGRVNGNAHLLTLEGTFHYIKYFIPIFIYAAFFRNLRDIRNAVRSLLILTISLGIIAIFQEVWALSSRYVLGKDLHDTGIYILRGLKQIQPMDIEGRWRFGLYRTSSLMGHYNIFGMYSLLILTVYLYMAKRINVALFIPAFAGVFTSISRTVFLGFTIIAGFQVFRGRRWLIVLLIPIIFFLYKLSFLPDFNIPDKFNSTIIENVPPVTGKELTSTYAIMRKNAREKALDVWKDHPVWGVGPGMFGSPSAVKNNSYLHEAYSLPTRTIKLAAGSIDQFWPQVLAETGMIGVGTYVGFYLSLIVIFYMLRQKTVLAEIKGIMSGLSMYVIAIIIYGLGANINMVEIIFTYSSLVGMTLGYREVPADV